MIVCIPSLSRQATTGKAFFCQRLAKALSRFDDVKVVSDIHEPHDVSLHVVFIEDSKVASKKILRLDGIYHNTRQDFVLENSTIGNHLKHADGVIYQSHFCRLAAEHYLPSYEGLWDIIFNGADLSFYDNRTAMESEFKYNFIAYSRWRPHKRLLEAIECFLYAAIPDSCLYVAGDLSRCGLPSELLMRYFNLPNVRYLGKLSQEQLADYLVLCDASIHLCWIDWCPNSVVEAIAAGIPVITNNIGGTPELVKPSGGYICEIDTPWDFQPCDLYSPPSIDRNVVAEALHRCIQENVSIKRSHVDIHHVALRYKEFFGKVLGQ